MIRTIVGIIIAMLFVSAKSANEVFFDDNELTSDIIINDESCRSPSYSKVQFGMIDGHEKQQLRIRRTLFEFALIRRREAENFSHQGTVNKVAEGQIVLDQAKRSHSWCLSRSQEYELTLLPIPNDAVTRNGQQRTLEHARNDEDSNHSDESIDILSHAELTISICGERVATVSHEPIVIDHSVLNTCYKFGNAFAHHQDGDNVIGAEMNKQTLSTSASDEPQAEWTGSETAADNTLVALRRGAEFDSSSSAQGVHNGEQLLEDGIPTSTPTSIPTAFPTSYPTPPPTSTPTSIPTAFPTSYPTPPPTSTPTSIPTSFPTSTPTILPTSNPTFACIPTTPPTTQPSVPTSMPTSQPSVPSSTPTAMPSQPTEAPTYVPTAIPTLTPSAVPTAVPTVGLQAESNSDGSSSRTAFVESTTGIGTVAAAGTAGVITIAAAIYYFVMTSRQLVKAPLAPQELAMQI